jgi:hypothetical protein
MWTDGARLYAGTLNGVLILDLHSQNWTRSLRSCVTHGAQLTGDENYVYFGTTSGITRIARGYWTSSLIRKQRCNNTSLKRIASENRQSGNARSRSSYQLVSWLSEKAQRNRGR